MKNALEKSDPAGVALKPVNKAGLRQRSGLQGKTAHHLQAEFAHPKKQFWGRHVWARGYFCCIRQCDRRDHS